MAKDDDIAKDHSGKKSAWETVICGATAGLVARFCIAPLDVLKIRLQLQSSSGSGRLYTGVLHGFRTIVRQEGLQGLWKGNVSAEILYVTYSAAQFLTYTRLLHFCETVSLPSISTTLSGGDDDGDDGTKPETGKRTRTTLLPRATHAFVAGAGAGAVATTVTYPFDLLRTRFAAQGTRPTTLYLGVIPALRQVVTTEGARGLYRGLNASIVQIVPYMGLLFGTYEPCRRALAGYREDWLGPASSPGWDAALAGFLAGSVSKTGVFPLDLIRKRLQVQGPARTAAYVLHDIPLYHSGLFCAAQIWRREGARGFYKGLSVSLLKSAPSSAITLWTFEQSSRVLRHVEARFAHVPAA